MSMPVTIATSRLHKARKIVAFILRFGSVGLPNYLTSEKKFMSTSQSLLRDRNMMFMSDCGRPHFLRGRREEVKVVL
jgi:hypothetical protein